MLVRFRYALSYLNWALQITKSATVWVGISCCSIFFECKMALSILLRKQDAIKWILQREARSWEVKDCTLCMQAGAVAKNSKSASYALDLFSKALSEIFKFTNAYHMTCLLIVHSQSHPCYSKSRKRLKWRSEGRVIAT
jgi:hypothetical protein